MADGRELTGSLNGTNFIAGGAGAWVSAGSFCSPAAPSLNGTNAVLLVDLKLALLLVEAGPEVAVGSGSLNGTIFEDDAAAGSGSLNGTIFGAARAFAPACFVAAFAAPRCFSTVPSIFSTVRVFSFTRSLRVPSSGHALRAPASARVPDGSTKIGMRAFGRAAEDVEDEEAG